MSRAPSAAPALPGFEYVRPLGSGGFADVFLYQQQLPQRLVAVKVLLADRLGTSAESFTAEANVMAQLATHPSIVSIYQAGVSGDGRPYLVMEFCSRPNLQVRHRRERFSEAETLRVGVQIAGAVETAHRAGVLHRDIKPANILVTDYGRPALTDFGIAATGSDQLEGMSIPWSPPESFRVPPAGDTSSDVWSLAATLYTLLTDRSPFQIAGASNTEIEVISRIQTMPLPPTGRSDVSAGLERVLQRAMSKDPADRYRSALEFARALQRVQIEFGMAATPVDVVEDEIDIAEEDDDGGRTRFRGITSIEAQDAPVSVAPVPVPVTTDTVRPVSVTRAPIAAAAVAAPPAPPVGDTVVRQPVGGAGTDATPAPPVAEQRRGRARLIGWLAAGGAVIVAAVVVVALVFTPQPQPAGPLSKHTNRSQPVDPGLDIVPTVTELTGTPSGGVVVFTWKDPAPRAGDTYLWRPVVPGQTETFHEADRPTVTVPVDSSGRTCIEVLLVRKDRSSTNEGTQGCAP